MCISLGLISCEKEEPGPDNYNQGGYPCKYSGDTSGPPMVMHITSPAPGTSFAAGDTIHVTGTFGGEPYYMEGFQLRASPP